MLMNYASPLQTIIPGSPWKRRIITAIQITSMQVQSWVFIPFYVVANICRHWSLSFFTRSTCWGFTLRLKKKFQRTCHWFKCTDLYFKLCSPCWEPQWICASCWITLLLSLLSKWPLPGETSPFFFISTKKNYTLFLTKQTYPRHKSRQTSVLERARAFFLFCLFLVFFPPQKNIASHDFPRGCLKRDSIKGNRKLCISNTVQKFSEEIDEGGTHSCTKSLLLFRNKQWRLLDALFIPPFSLMAYS